MNLQLPRSALGSPKQPPFPNIVKRGRIVTSSAANIRILGFYGSTFIGSTYVIESSPLFLTTSSAYQANLLYND